jgi:hypothetical protein
MNDRAASDLLPWILTAAAVLIMGVAVRYSSTDGEPDSAKTEFHSGAVPADRLPPPASRLRSSANAAQSSGHGT